MARFLYDQLHPDAAVNGADVDLSLCPQFRGKVYTYHSAVATFHAPSDICGVFGMQRFTIRSTPSWRNGPARHDCIFAEKDPTLPGFQGLYVAQVILFFSFSYRNIDYPCALVRWFDTIGDQPCPNTGMWMVEPEFDINGDRTLSIVHLDSVMRPAHLIPVYNSNEPIPYDLQPSDSLSAFSAYYVNKFSDYHAYEIVF